MKSIQNRNNKSRGFVLTELLLGVAVITVAVLSNCKAALLN